MFHQAPAKVCWSSYANPNSLINVGPDVIALLCQNIVVFHDVKTKAKSYYKADSTETCSGISLLAGHTRFPLFAIVEQSLRPSIYILKYPEMEKLAEFPTTTAVNYVDIHLSDHGFLLAVTGPPSYTLHMWNYRTGAYITHADTQKCGKYSLFVSPSSEPALIQFSAWHQEIVAYELCFTADKYSFHEITTIHLGEEYDKSQLFFIAALPEEAYVVNDYGLVSSVAAGRFACHPEWKTPQENAVPIAHKLFHYRGGLLVSNERSLYFIRKRQQDFVLDWQIADTQGIAITRIVCDANSTIYASTTYGNIYYVDHSPKGLTFKELSATNCKVHDYCLLKGIRDEVVLLLTINGELRLVDLSMMNTLSSLYIDEACCMVSHNTAPFVAVGTTKGMVHFISYEKIRAPVELEALLIDESSLVRVQLYDCVGLVQDNWNGLHIMNCDFKASSFSVKMSLEREDKEGLYILKSFLLNENRAVLFVSTEKKNFNRFAKYMWLLRWISDELLVERQNFELPYIYKDFTLIQNYTEDKVEFVGIRNDNFILDVLILRKNESIVIGTSIRTYNFGHMHSISGTRHIVTSATQGIIYHFMSHKRNKMPFGMSRPLLATFVPRSCKRMDDCFKAKYLILLYAGGYLMVFQLPPLFDSLRENSRNEVLSNEPIISYVVYQESLRSEQVTVIPEITEDDLGMRDELLEELSSLRDAIFELINYDILATGQRHGIYRKFCLNTTWLAKLIEGSRILCDRERVQLMGAVEDQTRIRNWILELIRSSKNSFGIKLRSIFTHIYFDNYAMYPIVKEALKVLDQFRFYDMEVPENEFEELAAAKRHSKESDEQDFERKMLKHYVFEKDRSVFEHVMSKDFELQDINTVTFHQVYNENAKLQVLLIDALKQEFNKEFSSHKAHKHETISSILDINADLEKIYGNMNCMLRLLEMETFKPPELSIPEWTRDELIERVLTVDDSEITAINRHKKIESRTALKSARMLLWPLEYWVRIIMFMMDGVLEKLWEDEIKKTPPPPAFVSKKHLVEYTLEDQKELKLYEKTLSILEEDRRKYLRILKDNEQKALNRKKSFILKFNKQIVEMVLLKLKYDFAIHHEQLRLLNSKLICYKRITIKKRIYNQRLRMDKLVDYITKYSRLHEYWDRTFVELKTKLETQTARDKQIERQFKGQYLNSVPAHLTHELNKIYKRRPKLPTKAFSTSSVCFEIAERVMSKKQHKIPIPMELQEFMSTLDSLDDMSNCPHQLDHRYWEHFVKIRRQKLESELRLKGVGYQLIEAQNGINFYTKEMNTLKVTRAELANSLAESIEEYHETSQNRTVEMIITMGQVEVNVRNSLFAYNTFMVMNVEDIDAVNELIRNAGRKKINAMQRVAFFRRQVIYKEWEHKVVKANIEYLVYVLKLIQKCKVTHEFLDVLRNWKYVQENKNAASVVGSIEYKIDKKIESAKKILKHLDFEVEYIKTELENYRMSNSDVDRQIEEMKMDLTILNANRDILSEEKQARDRNERFKKLKTYSNLIETVRRDYVQILELSTILELQRLRTYPTLGPAPQCGD